MDWNILLEYVRAVLSPHVVWGVVVLWAAYMFRDEVGALLKRRVKAKSPGGYELLVEESQQAITSAAATAATAAPVPATGAKGSSEQETSEGWRQAARIWEYRYLHYFLARSTQIVLDWLATSPSAPTIQAADAWWQASIPDAAERRAILDALRWHDLVALDADVIRVTDKGREYREFRGPLPKLAPTKDDVAQ